MIVVASSVTTNTGTTVPAITVSPSSWEKGVQKYQQTHNIQDFLNSTTTTDGTTLGQAIKNYTAQIQAGGGTYNPNIAATLQALEEIIQSALNNPSTVNNAQNNGTPLNMLPSGGGSTVGSNSSSSNSSMFWLVALLVVGALLFFSHPPKWM